MALPRRRAAEVCSATAPLTGAARRFTCKSARKSNNDVLNFDSPVCNLAPPIGLRAHHHLSSSETVPRAHHLKTRHTLSRDSGRLWGRTHSPYLQSSTACRVTPYILGWPSGDPHSWPGLAAGVIPLHFRMAIWWSPPAQVWRLLRTILGGQRHQAFRQPIGVLGLRQQPDNPAGIRTPDLDVRGLKSDTHTHTHTD